MDLEKQQHTTPAKVAPATTRTNEVPKNSTPSEVAAAKYFEQERQRKQQLPVYPGLERFEISEKLGEYDV